MRRNDIQQMSPAEIAIKEAMIAVEMVGADPRLTDAVMLLSQARTAVADYVDGIPRRVQSWDRIQQLLSNIEEVLDLLREARKQRDDALNKLNAIQAMRVEP